MSRINNYTVSIRNNDIVSEKIKFLPEEADDLSRITGILKDHGYVRGDYIISAYRIPGIVYLLGGTQPAGTLWGNESEFRYLERLRSVEDSVLKKTILITRIPLSRNFTDMLKEKNILFPGDYHVFTDLSYGMNEKNTISIYIPINKKN